MKRLEFSESWPESWKVSFTYDLEEIYGEPTNLGYSYAYKNRQQQALGLLREVVPEGATVLDIAAAQGNFSLAMAESGYSVTWNDLRSELEGYVRSKYEYGSLSFAPGNAFELEFPNLFDAILITEVIEHVAHPDDFLRKVGGLVKPGGYIIMTTPNGGYFRNNLPRFSDCPDPSIYESAQFGPNSDAHIFLLHEDEVRSLAEKAGLRVDSIRLFTNSLTNGHIKLEPLLKLLPANVVRGLELATQALPGFLARKLLVHTAARFQVPSRTL